MKKVLVLNANKQPLTPCHPAKARKLLREGKAAVFRMFPFTILLKDEVVLPTVQPLRLKLDPGSKTTGLAVLNDTTGEVVLAAEIEHRGQRIKDALDRRHAVRRNRRSRKTRYRKPRFLNRRRRYSWLPPSLESRIANIETWVLRLCRFSPIGAISQELVKFDTQLMQNPEVSGIEYQKGELSGYEVREYLLEKFARRCAYCKAGDVPLEIEHIVPLSRGGTNRVSNLTIACRGCNEKKGNKTAEEFGSKEVQAQACAPLRDAAAINATGWELYRRLQATGLPVEVGTGGRTKFNRTERNLPKAHWLDAACVGASTPRQLDVVNVRPLVVKATGHGRRQRCRPSKYGFPTSHARGTKFYLGFQTGDIVKAVVPNGKYAGRHVGRVAIRFRASFRLGSFDVHPKHLSVIHKADGYETSFAEGGASPPTNG